MATRVKEIEERVLALEQQLKLFSGIGDRLARVEAILGVTNGSEDSKVPTLDGFDGRLKVVEGKVDESLSKAEVCSLRLEELEKAEGPADGEQNGWSRRVRSSHGRLVNSAGDKEEALNIVALPAKSWGRKTRMFKGSVSVVGDSLARGAGYKLKKQLGDFVEVNAVGGAKLKNTLENIKGMEEDKLKTLVIVTGANNMADDYGTDMMEQYEGIMQLAKKVTNKIVVVGLIKRFDLPVKFEAKRKVINEKLKVISESEGIGFINFEPPRSMLHNDGLHLNFKGQDELGRLIHVQCKDFLE